MSKELGKVRANVDNNYSNIPFFHNLLADMIKLTDYST